MRKLVFLLSLLLTIPLTTSAQKVTEKKNILTGLVIPPLEFDTPTIAEEKLPSGATLLACADETLPFFTLTINFKGGSNAEDAQSIGSLSALTQLMEIGGAKGQSGGEIAEVLADAGIKLSIQDGYESWAISITALKKDFDLAFSVMEDTLLFPNLPEDQLRVIQNGMISSIRQRNDRPESIVRRKVSEILYKGYRRGTTIQPSHVTNINVKGLKADLKNRLVPSNVIVTSSGDFSNLPIRERLNNLFSQFPKDAKAPTIEDPSYASLISQRNPYFDKIVLVKNSVDQAAIQMSVYLPPHNHPDFYALQTGNFILGGGSFNSRLMNEVREDRGLAYYASSVASFTAQSGTLSAASGTKVESVKATLDLMLKIVNDFNTTIRPEELNLAKESILNSMVFLYNTPAGYLSQEIRFRLHGMPEKYLETFPKKIQNLSIGEIEKAYATYEVPSKMIIVVVGPERLKDELSKIRPVVIIGPEDPIP